MPDTPHTPPHCPILPVPIDTLAGRVLSLPPAPGWLLPTCSISSYTVGQPHPPQHVPHRTQAGAGRGDNKCIPLAQGTALSGGLGLFGFFFLPSFTMRKKILFHCPTSSLLQLLEVLSKEVYSETPGPKAMITSRITVPVWEELHSALLHPLSSGQRCGVCQHSATNPYHIPARKTTIKPSRITEH